jgi:1-acyl-sn-glycerol-3-phosphate acyltransferase
MSDDDERVSPDRPEVAKWDPEFTAAIAKTAGAAIRRYFRSEVRGVEAIPPAGGALVVANHSGGMLTPDVLIFAPAFYDRFGYDRPLYTLAHYGVFIPPFGSLLRRAGVIEASRENAGRALRDGAVVLVFPGGDYDSYRPTFENKIDFGGRTGYVRTAIEACRSCRWCPSAARRPNCSWRVAIPWPAGWD